MAVLYAAEATKYLNTTPVSMADATAHGGILRRYRATVTMATQTTSDTIVLAKIPAGSAFAFGILSASATLGGTATIAIGITGSTGKYRAAATHTVTTPTMFGVHAAMSAAPSTAEETIFITIAEASLPSSGTFIVDLYFSGV